MISLEDITTYDLIYFDKLPPREIYLLKRYQVTNFGILQDLINKGIINDSPILISCLEKAYKTLEDIKLKKKNPVVYNFSYFSESQDVLINTDKENKANVLFYRTINSNSGLWLRELHSFDIYTLKYLVGRISLDGNNACVATIYGLGNSKLIDLINNLKLYDEQIKRIRESMVGETQNIFTYQNIDKRKIILEAQYQILSSLFHLSNNFLFGQANENTKKQILLVSENDDFSKKKYKYRKYLEIIRNFLADYTTLRELQEGPSTQTLKRFIR